ncbi:hypothetical protein SNE40_014153 [Patella caerulea]|uniref:Uncharacterized protein n=1 Tax=Patella caerulea TaxID=87958 RepID=A0AAN8JHS2_PATCE
MIGSNVSAANKSKIIADEYIDLSILLKSNLDQKQHKFLYIDADGKIISKEKESNKYLDIEKWTDAFIIFMSIYTCAHPTKCHELLKYMTTIRMRVSRTNGHGWRQYGEQFRRKRPQAPHSSWEHIDYELWLLYMSNVTNPPNVHAPVAYTSTKTPNSTFGKCYDFNFKGL